MKGSALITGGARRVGAAICRALHDEGYRVLVHCHHSHAEGAQLVAAFNNTRKNSAALITGDLANADSLTEIVEETKALASDLSLLVNNASAFFPTPIGGTTHAHWDALINSNLRAPFFLAQNLHGVIASNFGSIINIVDIYADRPLQDHAVYSLSKAGLASLTKSLAKDLAPSVRVNGIAPGAMLWPENSGEDARQQVLEKIPLQRIGKPQDIARAVVFLATQADYITGEILTIDGGRSLNP